MECPSVNPRELRRMTQPREFLWRSTDHELVGQVCEANSGSGRPAPQMMNPAYRSSVTGAALIICDSMHQSPRSRTCRKSYCARTTSCFALLRRAHRRIPR